MNQNQVRLVLCVFICILSIGCQPAETPPETPAASAVETEPVPQKQFSPLSPEELKAEIGKQAGKVVLVDYWASYCVPCLRNFPHNKEWVEKYGSDKLVVLTMFMDGEEEFQEGQKFLQEQEGVRLDFRSALGGETEAMQKFGVPHESLPFYQIYDPQGKLAASFGAANEKPWGTTDLEAGLRTALGLEPEAKQE